MSEEDGPAKTVGTRSITVSGPDPIPFAVTVAAVDPRARYIVRVHLDADGDRQVSKGDFLTMESVPVLTGGHGSVVDVTARRF